MRFFRKKNKYQVHPVPQSEADLLSETEHYEYLKGKVKRNKAEELQVKAFEYRAYEWVCNNNPKLAMMMQRSADMGVYKLPSPVFTVRRLGN